MVTNPNTAGIYETHFAEMSQKIHAIGGLVYMDGANMNAIAGIINLNKIGVDAVHNNLHKTWSIPHGGGGPGDGMVAVSEKLLPFLPGEIIVKDGEEYKITKAEKTIGPFHRHFGNFLHKVRCLTYLNCLGQEGIPRMAQTAVLSARYIQDKLCLPKGPYTLLGSESKTPRMHEFIITLAPHLFNKLSAILPKTNIIPQVGKLFLDFGLHAPTVAFPETFGLMIEPTESFSKSELDHFVEILKAIYDLIENHSYVLKTAPHFTPIQKIDEVSANRVIVFEKGVKELRPPRKDTISSRELLCMPLELVKQKIISASRAQENFQ